MQAVRLNYEALLSRHQATQTTLWSMIAMALAAEAALWVGLTTLPLRGLETLLFACAFLMVGGLAPLSIRFFEISSMFDRQLMDTYERAIGLPNGFPRLLHGRRLKDRLGAARKLGFTPRQIESLHKRLLTKDVDERGLWALLDDLLTLAGQPSMMWTSVIAFTGIAGTTTAVGLAGGQATWTVAAALATSTIMPGLWLLSMPRIRMLALLAIVALLAASAVLTIIGVHEHQAHRTTDDRPRIKPAPVKKRPGHTKMRSGSVTTHVRGGLLPRPAR